MKKLAIQELNRISVEEFKEADKLPVCIVLDNLRSMNNVGSFFRTCDAFRIEKLYLCGYTPCPPHREITRSALGAELSMAWEQVNDTVEAVHALQTTGYRVLAVEQAERSISLETFPVVSGQRYALVFGNEVNGVDEAVMRQIDGAIEIPQFGTKHSLNVSIAAGIVLWHFAMPYLTKI